MGPSFLYAVNCIVRISVGVNGYGKGCGNYGLELTAYYVRCQLHRADKRRRQWVWKRVRKLWVGVDSILCVGGFASRPLRFAIGGINANQQAEVIADGTAGRHFLIIKSDQKAYRRE